jgi:hypothetical protein
MTNEQAISIMTIQRPRTGTKEKLEAYDMAIEALEQKPCEDCINRQAAIEAVKQAIYNHDSAIMRLTDLPPVTPQPKTGRWMHPYESDIACECSECHIQMPITKDFNYCPNCGTKMEVTADADSN